MTDNKEHTTQGGVDWELRTAEDAMVAAPGGSKELALAMRRHADGVRNMMQSELVPSFQNAIDNIAEKHTVRILTEVAIRLDSITGLVQQGIATGIKALAIGEKALAVGEKALAVSQSNAARLEHVEKDVAFLKQGLEASAAQWKDLLHWKEGVTRQIGTLNDSMQQVLLVSKEIQRRQGVIERDLRDIDTRHGEQMKEVMRLIGEGQAEDERIRLEIAALRAEVTSYISANKHDEYDRRLLDLEAQFLAAQRDKPPGTGDG